MTSSDKSFGKYWAFFLLSVIALVAFLFFSPEWCWVTFPFVCTYFVQAMDWM